ncbi:helix-turn-helix transcriptional regulator [Natronoflexus pectinivorans]|uniref:Helix-turn-helix protein n=1 Tax=Natronoflexus pectinivorans TaxID=682526 RepID=A0A4R2GFR6_9BACT|nr:helix-turn-helix domain-containing protein [Natronoflexus pectinivorans]TCO07032.1 helix-turn-helix protein [Natronoflexus pectinivorans]
MEQVLTFDQLPRAVTVLTKEVSELKSLLLQKQEHPITEQPEQLLTIQQASDLLSLSVATIYSKHSKGELPGVCKRGKRLYFQRDIIINWIKDGRIKTTTEIEQETEANLSNKKKGLDDGK